ncbi:hypothetical protein PanWU01x14_133550 [Parasponia andersonii]|uniref:Uncharacterized protein n=1 Tax=Parasponia andersonii TaxID=3476 RepID=A0A2P5CPX8_PARAD|nr:hypothetical protein PanWU01x14_133550 [Parasponia andersonii]
MIQSDLNHILSLPLKVFIFSVSLSISISISISVSESESSFLTDLHYRSFTAISQFSRPSNMNRRTPTQPVPGGWIEGVEGKGKNEKSKEEKQRRKRGMAKE